MTGIRGVLAGLAISLVTTLATWPVQRMNATQEVVGEGFCPTMEACRIPALGAGFPFPFMVDKPSVSVAGAVHFAEDDFRPLALIADLLIHAAVITLALWVLRATPSRS